MKTLPKDETIKKWIGSYKSKKDFQKEIERRLEFIGEDYKKKKIKLKYILKRLKEIK